MIWYSRRGLDREAVLRHGHISFGSIAAVGEGPARSRPRASELDNVDGGVQGNSGLIAGRFEAILGRFASVVALDDLASGEGVQGGGQLVRRESLDRSPELTDLRSAEPFGSSVEGRRDRLYPLAHGN